MRRSELAGLDVDRITRVRGGKVLIVHFDVSKGNQEGSDQDEVRVPRLPEAMADVCPVRAYDAWRMAAGIKGGKLFTRVLKDDRVLFDTHGKALGITPQAVYDIVRNAIRNAGLDGVEADDFGGHSLRLGLATAMDEAGAHKRSIQRQLRHKNAVTTDRYITLSSDGQDEAVVAAYVRSDELR